MKKLKFEKYVAIDNDFICNSTIDDIVVSTYVIMKGVFYDQYLNCSQFTISDLYDWLQVDSYKANQYKEIDNAITWLVDNKYIQLYDLYGNWIEFDRKYKNSYIVCFDGEGEDNYTQIPYCNLYDLCKYIKENKAQGFKKYQLIRYYLIIARVCSNYSKFYSVNMETISDITPISFKQCAKNNDALQDLGLIFYNNDYGMLSKSGKFKMNCTMFGHRNIKLNNDETRTMTKEIFDFNVSQYVGGRKTLVEVDKIKINNKRSETMKRIWAERKSG